MSLLDEELVVSDDSDFEDLFPTPRENQADGEIETVIDDEEYEVEEAPKKKRGRPAKAVSEKKPAAKKKKVEEEEPAEEEAPAPKKRGRPAKKVVAVVEEEESAPVVKKGRKKKEEPAAVEEEDVFDEETAEVVEKKPRAKRVSVDDFGPDVLDRIYEEYSQRPAAKLAEELNLPEKKIHKAVDRMKELFEMAISTGDLSEADYNELVLPKLEPFRAPKDCFDAYVRNAVKNIKKNKK